MPDTTGSIELARGFAETSSVLLGQSSLERTLEAVAVYAPASVQGTESACVSVITRDGALETAAYSDGREGPEARRLRGALEAEDGPARTAAADGSLLRIDDTAAERRWPGFARRAEELGVRSVIACGLRAGPGLRAALVLQSAKPGAFDGTALGAAGVYATHASAAITKSQATDSLRDAVRTRQVIGEATGILMERHRIDSPTAFGLLVGTSQNLNIKLRVVAEHIVRTGQDPQTLRRPDLSPEG